MCGDGVVLCGAVSLECLWCGAKLCAEVYRVRVVVQCDQTLCCDVIA